MNLSNNPRIGILHLLITKTKLTPICDIKMFVCEFLFVVCLIERVLEQWYNGSQLTKPAFLESPVLAPLIRKRLTAFSHKPAVRDNWIRLCLAAVITGKVYLLRGISSTSPSDCVINKIIWCNIIFTSFTIYNANISREL